jgi:hypothetical protein
MSDELWQRELAQVNRDQQEEERRRLDERWDRLSHRELSPEEEAELRALAETSEEARAAWEAFRPLGPDFHASVVQAVRKQGLVPPAKLLPFRPRLAQWSAVAALAAAASVVLLLRPPAPLPNYSLKVSGGVHEGRGQEPETAKTPVLAPGDRFQVVMRPQTAVSRASRLEALCFVARDREVHTLEARSEIYSGGAVKMEGSVSRELPPGAWTLWTVVGRRGKLPSPADLKSLSPGTRVRQRDWVAVPANVRIQPREPPP